MNTTDNNRLLPDSPKEFDIRWNRETFEYRVSIPNYEGGRVVAKEHHDAELSAKDAQIARLTHQRDEMRDVAEYYAQGGEFDGGSYARIKMDAARAILNEHIQTSAEAQIALLREALEFYANRQHELDVTDAEDCDENGAFGQTAREALAATPEGASAELAELRKDSARLELLNRMILRQDPAQQFHKLTDGPAPGDITLAIYNGREMVEYASNHLRNVLDAALKEAK